MSSSPIGRDSRQARKAHTCGVQDMGLEVGSRATPTATPQRRYDGHLQTFQSTTRKEHTKQVDADENEPVA